MSRIGWLWALVFSASACLAPGTVPMDGLALGDGAYLLVELSTGSPRVRRLAAERTVALVHASDQAATLQLWRYPCDGGLPETQAWSVAPNCLPAPTERHRYDPQAGQWGPIAADEQPPVRICTFCEDSPLQSQVFEFPERTQAYVGAATLIRPDRVLAMIGDGALEVPPAYYWIAEDRPRELTLLGLNGAPIPHLGALLKKANGEILGAGRQLWRLHLRPNEDDPVALEFEPWASGLPELPTMDEGRGAAAERNSELVILVSARGVVFEVAQGRVRRLHSGRLYPGGIAVHPADLVPFGADRLLAVGVGAGAGGTAQEPFEVQLTAYGLIGTGTVAGTTTVAVTRAPDRVRVRSATAVGQRAYLSDLDGGLWEVKERGLVQVAGGLLDNGPIGTLGGRILTSGSKSGLQQVGLAPSFACEPQPVTPAQRIISGEGSAYTLYGGGGSWLRPTERCPSARP